VSEYLLLYDRDCGLCRTVTGASLALDHAHRLRPLALQSSKATEVLQGMDPEERLASFHLVEVRTGRVSSAGAGLAELATMLPGGRLTGSALRLAPAASERIYRLVANHRQRIGPWIPSRLEARATRRVDRAESAD
jgi:predicted DCC family thiol-disulfide oxidoreductase YuxK